MTTVNASKVVLSPAFCKDNTNITSMDLSNAAFISNCMYKAFYNCTALNSVTNINSDVVDMSSTFTGCSNLTSVSSLPIRLKTLGGTVYKDTLNVGGAFANTALTAVPIIPSTVTNMLGTFANCTSLVSAGTIPSGVIDMRFCYMNCTNLTTAPTIPSSVSKMSYAFKGCVNLTGDIFIQSSEVKQAYRCFYDTSLTKNVYIPFKYANNVNTNTYNTFINEGYSPSGGLSGVYLKDIGTL